MVATPLTIVTLPSGYSDHPAAVPFVAGDNSAGNDFICTGREILKAHNTATETSEIITLHASAALTSGNYTLAFTIGGTVYTTANIPFDATAAQIAAAVLAATEPGGSSIAQAYPQGTITGAGGDLTVPTDVTLTFSGTGVPTSPNGCAVAGLAGIGTTGFAGADIAAPVVGGAPVGGTVTSVHTTPGAGLHHYTAKSTPDVPEQRLRDEGPIAVAPGQFVETQMFPQLGWAASGKLELTCDASAINFAVVRVPQF